MSPRAVLLATLAAAGLAAAAAGSLAYHLRKPAPPAAPAPLSAPATPAVTKLPAFALPDIDGVTRASSDWAGSVVLINFWATWCAPCRKELPLLVELHQRYAGAGLQLVGIAIDNADAVRQFAEEFGLEYPLLLGEDAGIELGYRLGNDIGALPYTVVTDRAGTIVLRKRGLLERSELNALLEPLLAAPNLSATSANMQ